MVKKIFYSTYRFFYILLNGSTPEADKELYRIQKAIEKVECRSNLLAQDFVKNRKELFRLLALKEQLINYECVILEYDMPSLGLSGTGNSKLVDEILDYKW